MATITSVKARQIFDSRGNPTVEVCFSSYICLHDRFYVLPHETFVMIPNFKKLLFRKMLIFKLN